MVGWRGTDLELTSAVGGGANPTGLWIVFGQQVVAVRAKDTLSAEVIRVAFSSSDGSDSWAIIEHVRASKQRSKPRAPSRGMRAKVCVAE